MVQSQMAAKRGKHDMSKRLFISHSWSYSEPYESMVRLLDQRAYFQWKNYSVPENKAFGPRAGYLMKKELREQIRPVNCVIIIGGHVDWLQRLDSV